MSNFQYHFQKILTHAGIDEGTFHDLRRTCITRLFAYGLSEFEVMILAGHASFETTRRFYMAVRKDIIERARKASAKALQEIFVAHTRCAPLLKAVSIKHIELYFFDRQYVINRRIKVVEKCEMKLQFDGRHFGKIAKICDPC